MRVLVVALLFIPAAAHSFFGMPSGLGHFGYGGRYGSPFDDMDLGGYFDTPPCPAYQPMVAYGWDLVPNKGFVARAVLPGVLPEGRRAWLSEDGSKVHLRAARRLPARGRRCLPNSARISADGRHELFDVALAVPRSGDISGTSLRELPDGLELIIPRRAPIQHNVESVPESVYTPRPTDPRRAPAQTSIKGSSATANTKKPATPVKPREEPLVQNPKTPPKPPAQLLEEAPALPDGVEVIDVNLPEPEKRPDAAEGWWDNRGTFVPY